MSSKLRDFIRNIRNCRTLTEERAVVAKESALIRSSLKEDVKSQRHRNIAKLLFIHMMGYPVDFGQIECLRLIASPSFADKRIGYLGLCQLMDEDDDLLMLVTNSIKNDLNNSSQHICTLALIALANIGSAEMCLTLAPEIEELCLSPNQFVRRKAIICSIRILRKVPDISERFVRILPTLVQDQSHGVLLSSASLICSFMECDPTLLVSMSTELTVSLASRLKTIITMSAYSSNLECDIGGMSNPFLQVKLLQAIRVLHQISDAPPTTLTDLLSQVIISTNGTKNTGCAVLLECTKIISCSTYDKSLVCLCQNILEKLLQNKDNNIRYVGISCVQQLIKTYPSIFEQQGRIMKECLKDEDSSIQRRALHVIYSIIDEKNISNFLPELVGLMLTKPHGILSYDEREFHNDLAFKAVAAIEFFSPTKRYQLDAIIHLLCISNDLHHGTAVISLMTLITLTPELQSYATMKLFFAAQNRLSKTLLLQTSLWALGEYGHLVIEERNGLQITPESVISFLKSCLDQCLKNPLFSQDLLDTEQSRFIVGETSLASVGWQDYPGECTSVLRGTSECFLNALLKLSSRIENHREVIRDMLKCFHSHPNVELQQRSLEYFALLDTAHDSYRASIVDVIPCTMEQVNRQPQLSGILQRPVGDITFNKDSLNIKNEDLSHLKCSAVCETATTQSMTTDLLFLQDTTPVHDQIQHTRSNDDNNTQTSKLTDLLTLLDSPMCVPERKINETAVHLPFNSGRESLL